MPSIRDLADQSGLAESTVKRALGVLAAEGLIFTVKGRGTFVRE